MASIQQLTSISLHPPGNLEAALNLDYKNLYHKLSPYANYNQNSLLNFGVEQPFMYTYIDKATTFPNVAGKYESRSFPVFSAIQDTIRISKFLTSGNGVLFLAKQLLLQTGNSFNETRLYSPTEVLVSAARPGALGLTNRVTRQLDTTGGGLVGILTSLVGVGQENSNQPSGTVPNSISTNRSPLSSDGEHISTEYRGLSRAGTANVGLSNLQSRWGIPSTSPSFLGALFSNFKSATQDGIIYKSSEGAYGIMIDDKLGKLSSTTVNGLILPISQRWIAGGSIMRKNGVKDYPIHAGRLFTNSQGNSYPLSNKDIQIGKLTIDGLGDVGYYINQSTSNVGYRYGESVGANITTDEQFTNSDIMIQYQNYVNPNNKYPYPSSKDRVSDVDAINATLLAVLTKNNIRNNNDKIAQIPPHYSYIASVPAESRIIGSGISHDNGYNRLFNTKKISDDRSGLNYALGVLNEYRSGKGAWPLSDDIGIGENTKRFPTSNTFDAINTLTVINQSQLSGTTPLGLHGWKTIRWYPYKHDQVAFYFYDIVNQNYIPFRASVTGINEGGTGNWEELSFIGRADKVYSYSGFTRNLSFKFTVNISSIEELSPTWQRINYLSTLIKPSNYTSDTVSSNSTQGTSTTNISNRFMIPPMIYLNIGDMYRDQPVILTSIGISIPDDASWETLNENNSEAWSYLSDYLKAPGMKYGQLPRTIDINVSMNLLEKEQPIVGGANFGHAPRTNIFKKNDWNTNIPNGETPTDLNKSLVVDVNT